MSAEYTQVALRISKSACLSRWFQKSSYDRNLLVATGQPLLVDCYESRTVFCGLKEEFRKESLSTEANFSPGFDQRRSLFYVPKTIFVETDHNLEVIVLFFCPSGTRVTQICDTFLFGHAGRVAG